MIVTFELPGDKLPEHCYDCPIHNGEYGHCQIDGRASDDWRPFWCPLRPVSELAVAEVVPHTTAPSVFNDVVTYTEESR